MARVLQLVTELVLGGASLTMLDFAEDLAGEHELVIAHGRLEDPTNAAARRARAGFATYELPALVRPLDPRADAAALRAFAALCRRLSPDVIHTHSSKAGLIGRLGAPPSQTGLLPARLHTVHGWGHTPLDGGLRRGVLVAAERLAARRSTKLIAVSAQTRDEGLALGIGWPELYAVIGAPVDMRRRVEPFAVARAQARATLGLPSQSRVVGWVGRFSPQKDPGTLAEVLRRLLASDDGLIAVLVGDGPEREAVRARLRAETALGRVRLTGAREDARELYAAFDVVLHTSRWEGDPRVVREALAEGVPVVSARVAGTGVLSSDPRLGAEVTPGRVDEYVAAARRMLGSRAPGAPIDEAALAALRASADEPYRLMRELYRSTLAQPRDQHAQRRARSPQRGDLDHHEQRQR